jgi:hypothetical protein
MLTPNNTENIISDQIKRFQLFLFSSANVKTK